MRRLCLGVVLASAACASAPIIGRLTQDQLTRADALVTAGCYDCLLDARTIYETAAVAKARPLIVARLFETDVLIGLRERELTLDSAASFARARALAPELPPTYQADEYLRIADSIPPDQGGTPSVERVEFANGHRDWVQLRPAWMTLLDTGEASLAFRNYVSISVDCAYATQGRSAAQRPPLPDGAPPLVRYRYARCSPIDGKMLGDVVDAVPRFVEANLGLARLQAIVVNAQATAAERALLTPLYQRFPASPAVTLEFGKLDQRVGDCKAALVHYDETIALKPRHDVALLQRTICLTYLAQSQAAIATATQIIDGKLSGIDDAFYWRAFNHRELHDLPAARSDSDRAKRTTFSDRVMLLAGMIEHDQDDLDIAEKDLNLALQADPRSCPAMWYLSLVAIKRQTWNPAATEFSRAMGCYEAAVRDDEKALHAMELSDVDANFKAQQILGFQTAIKQDSSQVSASAYNAAMNYLRAGDKDNATKYADLAAKDPARAAVVEELRKLIIR